MLKNEKIIKKKFGIKKKLLLHLPQQNETIIFKSYKHENNRNYSNSSIFCSSSNSINCVAFIRG